MLNIDIEGAQFRNKDHDCQFNRKVVTEAQGYQTSPDPLIVPASMIYLAKYDPNVIQLPKKVYYAPHFPGKPGNFKAEY